MAGFTPDDAEYYLEEETEPHGLVLQELEEQFNSGEYAKSSYREGGLNTHIVRAQDTGFANEGCAKFVVVVNPNDDLWITTSVTFEVTLSGKFPKERPMVKCVSIADTIRNDPRLLMVVEEPPPIETPASSDSDEDEGENGDKDGYGDYSDSSEDEQEKPKLYKPRIDVDGSVYSNLFTSRYMGWLEFYPLEVVVHTLRLLFRKTDAELAPPAERYRRSLPRPVLVESCMHEEKGVRSTMEDRVCIEDFRFVPVMATPTSLTKEKHHQAGKIAAAAAAAVATGATETTTSSTSSSSTSTTASSGSSTTTQESKFEGTTTTTRYEVEYNANTGTGRKVSLHAVFDGHGGERAAAEASSVLEDLFFQNVSERRSIARSLHNAVIGAEKKLADGAQQEKERTGYIIDTSGTTLCAVAVDLDQGVLYCANVGDSRAVLCKIDGSVVDLSTDDKATRPDEIARVVHTGGFVSYGRVLGMLAVSRALGDPEMKSPNPLISFIPSIKRVELEDDDDFILVACDGLYDVMTSKEACDYIRKSSVKNQDNLEHVTEDLVNHAINNLRSQDNVTVIIVKINHMKLVSTTNSHDQQQIEELGEEKIAHTSSTSSNLSPAVQAAVRASRLRKANSSSQYQQQENDAACE